MEHLVVTFHPELAPTAENKERVLALVENQTGLPAYRVTPLRGDTSVWGYMNERGSLLFVDPEVAS